MMWDAFREPLLEHFPPAPGRPENTKAYLSQIDNIYVSDAYHSLSIEGYKVRTELIECVREGNWNSDSIKVDKDHQNTFAVRGYWQAFQSVKQTISTVLEGKDTSEAAEDNYST